MQHNNQLPAVTARIECMNEETAKMLGCEGVEVISTHKMADIETLELTISTYEKGLKLLKDKIEYMKGTMQ